MTPPLPVAERARKWRLNSSRDSILDDHHQLAVASQHYADRCHDPELQLENLQFLLHAARCHEDLKGALEQAERRLIQLLTDDQGPCPTLKRVRKALALAQSPTK